MSEQANITAAVAKWLREQGVNALVGWSSQERGPMTGPTVVVSVEEYSAQAGGFENYLGERYNEQTSAWEEFYGKKVELLLGLDLYAPEVCEEGALQLLLEGLISALTLNVPEGLQIGTITCGQTVWDETQRRLKRSVTARCIAWLQATQSAGTEFLDFELRGGWKI